MTSQFLQYIACILERKLFTMYPKWPEMQKTRVSAALDYGSLEPYWKWGEKDGISETKYKNIVIHDGIYND